MADAQINNYVTRVRNASETLIEIYNEMLGLRDEYAKLGLSYTIIQAELDGLNLEVTGGEITSVMTAIDNLKTYFDAGNGTNLYKVKP
jgi:hypothetical protein